MANIPAVPTKVESSGSIHTREFDTWDETKVHELEAKPWVKPTSLTAPPPRPGFEQRWIRFQNGNDEDSANFARRSREGWRPRLSETIPASFEMPTIKHGRFAGCVAVEGLILCETPKQFVQAKRKAISDKTNLITNTLEADLQSQSDARMPITQQRSSKVVREVKLQDE